MALAEHCPGPSSQYEPLSSVWYGDDNAELLERLLAFYPRKPPHRILDATVNAGRFWRNSTRTVIGLDIDPHHRPTICGDNARMPFRPGLFDIVVYDPPHTPNQGQDRSKDFNTRFGLGARAPREHGYSFTHTYPAFMAEAYRVLVDEGLLPAEIRFLLSRDMRWPHRRGVPRCNQTAAPAVISTERSPERVRSR